ncbi:MAG: DoxX family protein [Phycisphaerales bacterium]
MRFRDQVALTLPALFLRVLLASVFIWAGLAKITTTVPVTPDTAAALASLGVPIGPPVAPEPEPAASPRLPEPSDGDAPTKTTPTETPPPATELPDPETADPQPDQPETDAEPPADAGDGSSTLLLTAWSQDDGTTETDAPAERRIGSTAGIITASDFPEGGSVRTLEMLALVIDNATNPPLDADSNRPDPIWPDAIGSGPWPRVHAWSVAIVEVAAGVFILLGLFTRLSALSLFAVMLGAMWLTQIGPAMQSSATMLGFLPDHALNDFDAWGKLWMQFSLAVSALALAFLGAGPVSIDRAIFRRSSESFDAGPKYTTATDPPPESRRPV